MWNLQLNDSCLSCAHNFLFSELSHMYNLIWAPPKSCDVHVVNPWNQISHKGQVFSWQEAPRLQTSQKRQYKYTNARPQRKKKNLHHSTKIPPGPPHSFTHSASQLTCECWGLPQIQSGLTKHQLLILSAVWASAAVCLSDPMLGDLHSNKERLTCFITRHEEKKLHSGASWDSSFFFFFCGGVETHIFLNQGESCLLSHKSMCEWFNPPLLLCVVVTIWLRDFDVVKL